MTLWRGRGGSSRVFHQQFRVLTVQRHSINRRLVFVFLLDDAKEFVGAQPKWFPNKIIFAGDANCLVAAEVELFNSRLWTIPVFLLMLRPSIDIHQQRLAV